MRSDDEIRKKQMKLEGVAAPLGDSSENSQLLQRLLYEEYSGKTFLCNLSRLQDKLREKTCFVLFVCIFFFLKTVFVINSI